MKIDLMKIDHYCDYYKLPEVTSSNLFSSKNKDIDPNGLVSYEIFGKPGTEERKWNFAYINLNGRFINPHVMNVLVGLKRAIKSIINGEGNYSFYNGDLIKLRDGEAPPKGCPKPGTGIEFLYKHWDLLDFKPKKTDAQSTYEKKQLIHSLDKSEVFITKFIVIPAFYRDVDMGSSNVKKKNVINTMYMKLINNAALIKNTSAVFDMFGTSGSHKVIQDTLYELYTYFLDIMCGVHGFIHEHVMGKSTDYSARCVISGPRYDVEKTEDAEVSFTHSALPLSVCCKIFAPYIVYGIKQIITKVLSGRKFVLMMDKKAKTIKRVQLAHNWADDISSEKIHDLIDLFYKSVDHRVDYFYLRGINGEKLPLVYMTNEGEMMLDENEIEDSLYDELAGPVKMHPITLTELFYMAAENTVSDKVIYVSRYPIEDYNSIYPSKFNIIPCEYHTKKVVDGKVYKRFPVVSKILESTNIRRAYIDTLRMFCTYLAALDADFDGDTVSVYSVYTDEAIECAKKHIYSISNISDIKGVGSTRDLPEVVRATIYCLSYSQETFDS